VKISNTQEDVWPRRFLVHIYCGDELVHQQVTEECTLELQHSEIVRAASVPVANGAARGEKWLGLTESRHGVRKVMRQYELLSGPYSYKDDIRCTVITQSDAQRMATELRSFLISHRVQVIEDRVIAHVPRTYEE